MRELAWPSNLSVQQLEVYVVIREVRITAAESWGRYVSNGCITFVVSKAGSYDVAIANSRYPLQGVRMQRYGSSTEESLAYTLVATGKGGMLTVSITVDETMLVTIVYANGMTRRLLIVIDSGLRAHTKREGTRHAWKNYHRLWTVCTLGRLALEDAQQVVDAAGHHSARVAGFADYLMRLPHPANGSPTAELQRLRGLSAQQLMAAIPSWLKYLGALPPDDRETIFDATALCLSLGPRADSPTE
jgi:hypothetical protein